MVMAICKGIVFLDYSELEAALEDGDVEGPIAEEWVKRSNIWWGWNSDLNKVAKLALEKEYDVAYLVGGDFPRFFGEDEYYVKFYNLVLD